MNKLSVFFYGPKSKFLHGNKSAPDLGRLRDVLVNEGSDRANLLPDQLWLLKLCDHVQKVEDLMSLCVSFLDTYQSFDVTKLGDRPSGISDSTHSNWASPKNPGPREDIGLAMAALYGFGCPDDDPSRPMAERRKLWKACNDPLWRLWCDGDAREFIDAYTRAISENRLWFPASVRGAMQRQPTRRPSDVPQTPATVRSLRQCFSHVWSQFVRHDALKLAGFASTLVLLTGTGVAFWTDKMTSNNRPDLQCALPTHLAPTDILTLAGMQAGHSAKLFECGDQPFAAQSPSVTVSYVNFSGTSAFECQRASHAKITMEPSQTVKPDAHKTCGVFNDSH